MFGESVRRSTMSWSSRVHQERSAQVTTQLAREHRVCDGWSSQLTGDQLDSACSSSLSTTTAIRDVFQHSPSRPTVSRRCGKTASRLYGDSAATSDRHPALVTDPDAPMNFIDNHDVAAVSRSTIRDQPRDVQIDLLHNALVFIMTEAGDPLHLLRNRTGALSGGNDPANRERHVAQWIRHRPTRRISGMQPPRFDIRTRLPCAALRRGDQRVVVGLEPIRSRSPTRASSPTNAWAATVAGRTRLS